MPAIVARYAGDPLLPAAVEAAVRAQQNNDAAVGAALVVARVLERVVLVGTPLPPPHTNPKHLPPAGQIGTQHSLSELRAAQACCSKYKPPTSEQIGIQHCATHAPVLQPVVGKGWKRRECSDAPCVRVFRCSEASFVGARAERLLEHVGLRGDSLSPLPFHPGSASHRSHTRH